MRKVFDAVKCKQNLRPYRRTFYSVDYEADQVDYVYNDDDNSSDDEGTNPPIPKLSSSICSSIPALVPVNTHNNLLSGFTKENCEINVNTKHTSIYIVKYVLVRINNYIFFNYNYRLNHYHQIYLMTKTVCSTSVTFVVQLAGITHIGRVRLVVV